MERRFLEITQHSPTTTFSGMAEFRQQRAFAASQLGQCDVARREATAALAANPDDQFSRLILGESCMRLEDYSAGREQALELLRVAPNWGWGHWLLAWCGLLDRHADANSGKRTVRLNDAQLAAERALALDPDEPAFYEVAAAVAMESGQYDAAMQLADRGLSVDPNCQFLLRLRGQVFHATGEPYRATEAFRASLHLAPEDNLSHRELARVLFARGEYRAARDHIREAIRLDPSDDESRQLILKISQTQHWLLRAAIWLHQNTRWVRLWFPLWVIFTAIAGLPVVIWAEAPERPQWMIYAAYSLWMLVVWFPLESLVLPLLADMLWVVIGQDAARRSLTMQERWDRLAPGIFVLTVVPVIILSVALQSSVLPVFFIMLTVLALLQSGAAARDSRFWNCLAVIAGVIYLGVLAVMFNEHIHFPDRTVGIYTNFHVYTLIGSLSWRLTAARNS